MNDHNLNDLIIENIEPKNAKAKSVLTIVALLIIVFIVAIIMTGVFLDNKDENNNTLAEKNDTEMISPELTLQSVTAEKSEKDGPKLTDIIEEKLKAPVVKDKEAAVALEKTPAAVKTKKEPVEKPVEKEPMQASLSDKEETVTPKADVIVAAPANKKVVEPKAVTIDKSFEETPDSTEKEVVALTPKANKSTATPKQHTSSPQTKSHKALAGNFYIQVGSFSHTPSAKYLGHIRNNGFHYLISQPTATGSKKLLIGPYRDRHDATAALTRVKDLVNKNAFVVKK